MARMSATDRLRWDAEYAARGADADAVRFPAVFADHVVLIPRSGTALDLACGRGAAAVWLAERGLDVRGLDVSPVAVGQAEDLAVRRGVGGRCRFDAVDLDEGLPPGPRVEVMLCHRFRAPGLYPTMVERLEPEGLLFVAVLSEVGGGRGRFRAAPGELESAFADLDVIGAGEGNGVAWLVGRRTARPIA